MKKLTAKRSFKCLMAMKFTILLLTVACMQVSARSGAQTITYEAQNVRLVTVFAALEKQTGYAFFYNDSDMQLASSVSVSLKKAPLPLALQTILKDQPLDFNITGKTIVVSRKSAIIPTNTPAQNNSALSGLPKDVSGRVLDEKGRPVEGVTVTVKKTGQATATDANGYFVFSNIPDDATLVFTGVNIQTTEINVSGRTVIPVNVKMKVAVGEEVIVSTGYYSLPKERATGAYSHVTSKKLEEINGTNLKNKLEGLVPGLMFEPNYNSDQNPSTERSSGIVIRGRSTLGDNNPLIVVDGFPVIASDGVDPWSTINPEDVESVTVLKDAAAASIWGAQAANGVIVITTKSGKVKNGSSVSVSMEYLTKPAPDLYEIPFASSKEAVDIYKHLFFETTYFNSLTSAYNRNRYDLPEVIDVLLQMKTNQITEEEGNQRLAALSKTDVRDEFSQLFFRPEATKKVTVSFSNNNKLNDIRASVMAMRSDEFAIGNANKQVIANLNNKFSPVDWFSVSFGANISFRNDDKNGVDIRDLQYIPQMSRILDDSGKYVPMIKQNDDFYYDVPTTTRRKLVAQYDLPYDWDWNIKREVDNKDISENRNDIRLNAALNFRPLKGLNVDFSYQYQNNNSLYSNYMNPETWYVRNAVLENYRVDDGSFPIPVGGMLYERRSSFTSHDGRFQVTYNRNFGDHNIRALGGSEIRADYRESIPYGFYGYDPQSLTQITALNYQDEVKPKLTGKNEFRGTIPPIPTLAPTSISIGGRNDRFLSYYGNVGYTYKNRYDLTGSIRLDQTNLYGRSSSYRELPQWSIGTGYTLTNEAFFNVEQINHLRFRIAYGWNGHIDKSASPYIVGTPWIDPVNQSQYAAVLQTPNPALTWEKTANLNFGVDFGLFNNRIKGLVEIYNKKSTNVLADFAVNPTYGFYYDEATLNQGDINNKGVEFEISALVVDQKIKWRSTLNYSHNKNEVVNVNSTSNNMAARTGLSQFNPVAGQPVDYIAVAEWAGFNDDGLLQVMYQGKPQSILEIPYTGADLDDLLKFVGQRSPKHFGSWINNVSYGNFELSARLLYSFGNKFLNDAPPRSTLYNVQRYSNYFTFLPALLVNRWQSPDDNQSASMYGIDTRVANYTATLTNDYLSEYNTRKVLDAGQIRLQSISLTYRMPKKLFGSTIKDASLQLQARDLGPIFLANDEGIDPLFPKYSGSLYSAYYNTIRERPEYSVSLRISL
jgi:TonB-linked SusC/RagA family outer membrane protein